MYKVSVIIPLYKVENYLRECLDSVVNQTLKDIEVICVDDGSPDRSADIAAEYVEKYSNFKLIRKENGGQSSARNAALEIAQGEYVYFLDSDDYIDPTALEEVCRKADVFNLDMVFFNTIPFFESDDILEKNKSYIDYYTRKGNYPDICTGQALFAKMRENREFFGSPCLEIFRRSLIEDNHLRFYEGIIHEDNLFTFQCIMLARKAGYIDKAYYHRRLHDNSTMTTTKSMRNVEGYIVSYYEALAFLRNIKIEDDVSPFVNDFLYYALYRNGCNIWNGLSDEEKKKPLQHGGVGAEQLLYVVKKTVETENHKKQLTAKVKALTQKNKKLTKKLSKFKKSPWQKLLRLKKRLKKNAKKFFKCASKKGYGYAVRKAVRKTAKVTAKFMSRHTSGPVKTFFTRAHKKGCRYALRKTIQTCKSRLPLLLRTPIVKLHQKIGSKTPLVSFVLPVYNVEEFLPECLDSLIRQSMPHIEIICVDDGSTDRSLEILKEYATRDSRIKVFTQKNQYAGAARNLGMSHATGEYLVFLDSDDFFSEDLAKEAYFAAKVNKADAVIFSAMRYDHSKKEYLETPWFCNKKHIPKNQPFSRKDCPDYLFQTTTAAPWTKMFRREFIQSAGLQFQTLHNANDVFFSFSALALAERIVTVSRPLVYYRIGMTTNLQATKQKNPLCFFDAYKALHDKLAETGILDELRQTYVNATVANCAFSLNTTLNPEAKLQIYNKLRNGGLEELELLGHDSDYYYDQKKYQQVQQVMEILPNKDLSLSVIIPVYNVEEYLEECLDSVIQSNLNDLEIICVNDGSTDRSLEILEEYAARDSRIRVIDQGHNKGLLMARKVGVEAATKGHIIFLDSDDYITADLFDFIRCTIMFEPAEIIQFTIGIKDYANDPEAVKWLAKNLRPANVTYKGNAILDEAYIRRSYSTSLLGKIFRTDLCKKVYSLLPDAHCYVGEDIFTYFFLAYFADSYVGISSKEFYIYRRGLGVSNSNTMPLEKFEIYCKMALWCRHTRNVLLADSPSASTADSFEAMVSRMSQDCYRIYQNRIAESDQEAAMQMLTSYWGDFPTAQQMAKKTLGTTLQ